MQMEIRFKKCGISNQPMFASLMIRVFPSLEHSTDCVRKSWDNLRTFVWRFCRCWIKHNRAKPMSELPSALFSIADGSEFRFARFYNVCEAAALAATRKFAHCLWFVGHTPGVSKRGRDTEFDANIEQEEMHTFFSNEYSIRISIWNPTVWSSNNITYQSKERYAYCGSSFV